MAKTTKSARDKAADKSARSTKPKAVKKKPAKARAEAPPTGGANLYALLIACDFYLPNRLAEGSYPNLGGCVRDVQHIEDFLRRRLGLTDERLVKLTSTDGGGSEPREPSERRPTYENMVNAFNKVTQLASKGDQVYVHYSGHGGRTPTIVPKVKGPRALDEALVPIDIGNTSARYLRDVEIAKLLGAMVDKGLVVTVVFDCCHSGGAARAALRADTNLAVRGVSFVDSTPRPTDSLVGSAAELAEALPPADSSRGAARDLAAHAESLGYTLLAACRPSESCYETAFEGSERNGALTYWLVNALQQLSPELTYRMVYDRVLARVHSQFEKQTPLLQGDPDRVVFGTVDLKPESATPVLSVAADGRSVRLAAGQANLLRPGAQFAVYPNGTLDFTQTDKRTALVRVREIGAAAATADVVKVFGAAAVQPGDQAVLLGAPSQKLVRKVRLERADGKPPAPADRALLAVLQALPGNGWVEAAAGPADAADFVVRLSDDRTQYRICDADGQPIPLRPEVGVSDTGAAATVTKRLAHLARYRAVRELDNFDSTSPLKGKLVVKLLGVQDDYQSGDRRKPKPFPAGAVPTLRMGQTAFLSIENRSSQVLNVAVLDLKPNWGIDYAEPQETNLDFTPLDPNAEPLVIDLPAGLSEGYTSGTDTLKVIATVDPTSFRTLVLPPLDQPAAASRDMSSREKSPLEALLSALTADRAPSRDLTTAASPSRGWVVAQVEVRVTSGQVAPSERAAAEAEPAGAAPPDTPPGTLPPADAFLAFRERKLSLWQSAVEEVVARRLAQQRAGVRSLRAPAGAVNDEAVRTSDPVQAATALAAALYAGEPLADPQPVRAAEVGVETEAARGIIGTAWKCNKVALQLAWARVTGDTNSAQKLADELAFNSCDPLWLETVERYVMYFLKDQGTIPYRKGSDSVLDVPLPRQATVALLADWGTGTPTAIDLLGQIARKNPDVVLHLGDIYYSGTESEVRARFLDVCRQLLGNRPLFSLSGNHDMYSGGAGYYWLVDQLGQKASYFCLRNADWQFLAMDTGFHDFNPFTVNSNITYLTDEEAAWHRARIEEGTAAGRKTVLLSHHQLFSAYEAIGKGPVNHLLLKQFRDVLGSVAAWFWGHEHSLSIYAPHEGLRRGRCLGCAAVPVFVDRNYYTPQFDVPLVQLPDGSGRPVMLGDNGTVYNHAYAILKLDGPKATVAYYQHTDEQNALYEESLDEG